MVPLVVETNRVRTESGFQYSSIVDVLWLPGTEWRTSAVIAVTVVVCIISQTLSLL